ncbi:OLC1v1030887C1 [Oldenlandia corymbosa var. corymbosa]|uniref:OLC1v1030887C1 n=1 Tax=Oldenlandia corymbosa var. corymbosa TaxID=529605 RepID=A0AAV1CHS4_OLDCO|nr:OLC1v1030887C1 [Oldenlandia corymbosa var. corymbosa]
MASTNASEQKRINVNTVRKAVRALQKWRKLHPKVAQKPASFNEEGEEEEEEEENHESFDKGNDENEDFIYLLLTLKKIPPKELSITPHKIPLPYPLHSHQEKNICLIIDDRPTKSPGKITAEVALKKIKSENIPITKVLKLSKLKSDCKSFEGRRNLYNSFGILLADEKIVPLLPKILGKQFYKKKRKVPVPLDLRGRSSWKEQIEKGCDSSLFCLGSGTCSILKVGICGSENGMGSDEIVENVGAAVKEIAGIVPKKWRGIRALHLKLSDSLALPIYDPLAEVKADVEDEEKMEENSKLVGGGIRTKRKQEQDGKR